MVLFQSIKKKKKSATPKPVGTTATASKVWTLFILEMVAYKNKEVICLYIDTWIEKEKISKSFVYSNVVVKLINQKGV